MALALSYGVVVAADAAAAKGDLTQKAGTAGCISDDGSGGVCVDGRALVTAVEVTVSPDGTSAYVASMDSDAVVVFDRAADGALTQKAGTAGCVSETGAGPCADGTALELASSVTVSPDGENVYVASGDVNDSVPGGAVAVFDRAADGALTQKAGAAGCISESGAGGCADGTALDGAFSVTASPDGASVYVAAGDSDAVAVFERAADGTLTQKAGTAGCVSETGAGPCADGRGLDLADAVTVSPDGENAYVASNDSDAVAVFDRAADGTLTQKVGTAGCVSETGADNCQDGQGLVNATSITVSPNGESAYVGLAVFDRAADGTLTQKAGTAAGGAVSVTVSPDGESAYAVASNGVSVFDRAADGTLTQKAGTAGCVSETGAAPCADGRALHGAISVTVSPDGENVYAASFWSAAVSVFDRATAGSTSPPADGDGDGVPDAADACPAVAGTLSNGCVAVTGSTAVPVFAPVALAPAPAAPGSVGDDVEPGAPLITGSRSVGNAAVSLRGALTVPKQFVDCAGEGADCKVRATLSGRVPSDDGTASAKRRRTARIVQLGRSVFTVKSGKGARVRVKLTRTGLQLLKRHRKIEATVKIVVTRSGVRTKKSVRLTLKAPRKKRTDERASNAEAGSDAYAPEI